MAEKQIQTEHQVAKVDDVRSADTSPHKRCKWCSNPGNANMMKCSGCDNWYHTICVGASGDITEMQFSCESCEAKASNLDKRVHGSSRGSSSHRSQSSSYVRKRQLVLDRIEEERKLSEVRDKQYLDKKYQALEELSQCGSLKSDFGDDDSEINQSRASNYTAQWVKRHSGVARASSTSNLHIKEPVSRRKIVSEPDPEQHRRVGTTTAMRPTFTVPVSVEPVPSVNSTYRNTTQTSTGPQRLGKMKRLPENNWDSILPYSSSGETENNDEVSVQPCAKPLGIEDVSKVYPHMDQPTLPPVSATFSKEQTPLRITSLSNRATFAGSDWPRMTSTSERRAVKVSIASKTSEHQPFNYVVTSKVQPSTQMRVERPLTTRLDGFDQWRSIDTDWQQVRSTVPAVVQSMGQIYTTAGQTVNPEATQVFSNSSTSEQGPMRSSHQQTLATVSAHQSYRDMTSATSTGTTQTSGFSQPSQNLVNMSPQIVVPTSDQREQSSTIVVRGAAPVPAFGRTLTPNQIAARQVVPRRLPTFAGEIEKFPSFLRAFETSTEMCGFTNGENMTRLADSLKGVALEYVEQQLFYPDDVPSVIESLKMMFGRPEFVIDKLMANISKQPSPQADDLGSIVKFSMSVQNICGTIRTAKATEHLKNPTLMKALVDKLPPSIQLNWASYKQGILNANLDTLGGWLHELAKLASSISGPPKVKKEKSTEKGSGKGNEKSSSFVNAHVESSTRSDGDSVAKSTNGKKCLACSQSSCQRIKDCKKFISLNPKERMTMVREKNLCFRCFGGHRMKECKSKAKCNADGCKKAHHSLLHDNEVKSELIAANKENKSDSLTVNCSHQSEGRKVDIFRIAPVVLYQNGITIPTFAYMDDGSNITMMEDALAMELGLEGSAEENLCVKWSFGKEQRKQLVSKRVSVTISGGYDGAAKYTLHNVRTVKDLALPSQTITQEWLESYRHFDGIPIETYVNAKPRLLIGLQYSKLMVSRRTVEGKWAEPIACKTRLGWIVQGPDGGVRSETQLEEKYSLNICECQRDYSELHKVMKDFFSWDNCDVKSPEKLLESNEIQRARKILETTTKKINGRYETGLLWRFDDVEFPETYRMALKRLECLERKMASDPVLATKMCDYIQDFVAKGYVRKLTEDEQRRKFPRVLYLPMFPVFNPKKPEKFRVVWDAAATVNKISLNSMLLAGPDLLNPLPDVLRRFRENPIAITGDIKEMFHQVRVIDADIQAQRFLWRGGNSKVKPDAYVMEVLTFGGKNSPSSAQYVKNKNALEYKDKFPRAVEAITENHYQDDLLESCNSVDEAIRLTEEVKFIHSQVGFEMRSFKSNSVEVLEKLGEQVESQQMDLDISIEPTTERVLGMFWNTSADIFTFSLKFTKLPVETIGGKQWPTKREVLRSIMSIFDPLGLIAHYLVHGKILLQQIWRDGTNWDEKLSELSYKLWLAWIDGLSEIEKIEIPRWYSPKLMSMEKKVQLHVFVDASFEAAATAAYFRVEDECGVDCSLIGAKTKVAPNKPLSMPRLELQAAVMGVRLAGNIGKCHRLQVMERFFWSDSQTVLGWINSEARKFHQYVAFRIGEIVDHSLTTEWNWVDTKNNVADDATRWKNKPDLSSTSRWYKAPSFLYQQRSNWPAGKERAKFSTDEEMRAVYLLSHVVEPNNDVIKSTNFSNWNRLQRAMAYVLRFIDNSKLKEVDRQFGPLSRDEHRRARDALFRQAQREEYMEEIIILRSNESLPAGEKKAFHKSSPLRTFSPYLDEAGVLRVRGRIENGKCISFPTKRPVILPRRNRITKLLVLSYHQKLHHVNHQTALNNISKTFAIPALRVVLKGVVENMCQRCKNSKAKPLIPEMAELPPARLAAFTPAYTYTGVDYFGPMKVKVRRSVEKRWAVIFTCLTTRAVYIDVAHSLDTSTCIMCVRNFINRNIQPLEFYSDNGTNFAGADKELRKEFAKLNQEEVETEFTNETTTWKFNPPTAAHMGGAWERLIRTVKSVLRKSMPTRTPTDQMLVSFLIEAENIVNSRPLTYVQLDNVDDEVLTPNHFIKPSPEGSKSPGRFDSKNLLRDDWKAVQEMTNHFWKRFVVEYLPTLTRRTKWFADVKRLEVGDVVIVVDEEFDRNTWKKGIIEEVSVGKGNKVRRALVRLIKGKKDKLNNVRLEDIKHKLRWRPAAKLAVLDVEHKELSSIPDAVNGEGNVVNAS